MPPGGTSRLASLSVRIRRARADERLDLEQLMRRASTALPDYRAQLEENPDAIDLPLAQIEHGQVIVAETVEGAAGFIVLLIGDDRAEIDGLFVEPQLWGRGVGRSLVELAVHEGRRSGLSLTVAAAPGARGFYERCGFTFEGETQTRFGTALIMSR
jgi:GNAT superfamily N-acetyltransferase